MLQRTLLNVDAFALPLERKESKLINYAQLYHDTPLVSSYIKKQNEESNENKKTREDFEKQFKQLLNEFKKWGNENNCITHDITSGITTLENNFFDVTYSGMQTPEYFSVIKLNLEKVWSILNNNDDKIPKKKKIDAYKHLCSHMNVCAPGIYTHVEDTVNFLTTEISLERWLSDLRTQFIRQFSDIHCHKMNIAEGNSIHVYNAFLVYALNEGLAPLSHISQINDPFISATTKIYENDVTRFFTDFYQFYSPNEIINCIATNFFYELKQVTNELGLEEKAGWIPATPDLLKKIKTLANTIGIGDHQIQFFDYSEDALSLRFNPTLFKANLLCAFKHGKYEICQLTERIEKGEENLEEGKIYLKPGEQGFSYFVFGMEKPVKITKEDIQHEDCSHFENLKLKKDKIFEIIAKNGDIDQAKKIFQPPLWREISLGNYMFKTYNNDPNLAWFEDSHETIVDLQNQENDPFLLLANISKNAKNEDIPLIEKSIEILSKQSIQSISLAKAINYLSQEEASHFFKNHQSYGDNLFKNENDIDRFVKLLDPNKTDIFYKEWLPIIFKKCIKEGDILLLKYVISLNKNILNTVVNEKGMTAVHVAAERRSQRLLAALVESQADVNIKDSEGNTPIHIAARNDHGNNINYLIRHKANPNLQNRSGKTPLHMAVMHDLKPDEEFDEQAINSLLRVADLDLSDSHGCTPMLDAMRYSLIDVATKLSDAKADITKMNNNNVSPLLMALDNVELIGRFTHFPFNKKNIEESWNALHIIAPYGNTQQLKIAIEAKCDFNKTTKGGMTPILFAAFEGNTSNLKSLMEYKAIHNIGLNGLIMNLKPEDKAWKTVVFLLMNEPAEEFNPKVKSILQKNREKLKNYFIEINKESTKQESDLAVFNLLNSNNALGCILNTPTNKVSHFFTSIHHHWKTQEVYDIVKELKYDEKNVHIQKVKKP